MIARMINRRVKDEPIADIAHWAKTSLDAKFVRVYGTKGERPRVFVVRILPPDIRRVKIYLEALGFKDLHEDTTGQPPRRIRRVHGVAPVRMIEDVQRTDTSR